MIVRIGIVFLLKISVGQFREDIRENCCFLGMLVVVVLVYSVFCIYILSCELYWPNDLL